MSEHIESWSRTHDSPVGKMKGLTTSTRVGRDHLRRCATGQTLMMGMACREVLMLCSDIDTLETYVEELINQNRDFAKQLAALQPKPEPAPAPEPEVGEPDTSKWPNCLKAALSEISQLQMSRPAQYETIRLNLSIAAKMINDAKAKAEVVDTRNYAGSEPVAQREVMIGTGKSLSTPKTEGSD